MSVFKSLKFALILSAALAGGNHQAQADTAVHNHIDCGVDVRPEDIANGDYGGFYTWPELVAKMDGWLEKYPTLIQCQSLGTSTEGRKIPLLKISDNPDKDEDEPELLYVVGIHPREQAPTVAIVHFVDELLGRYGTDPEITGLINTREIWVVPMLNVDGKIFDFKHGNGTTRGADWRKNRRPNADGTFGVDLNRNFPVRWGGDRSYDAAWRTTTADTRGNIYEGPSPASEPEILALTDFIRRRPLRIMLDLHSPLHDMRAPGFLSAKEQPIFDRILKAMQATQKAPYPLQIGAPGKEPGEKRTGNTGVSFVWSYYTTGAYSFNIEMGFNEAPADAKAKYTTGIKARYATDSTVVGEYTDNIRGPLMTLLKVAGELKLASPGSVKLAESTWDGGCKAGDTVIWKPKLVGAFDYAVATSSNPAGVVKSEYRLSPAASGFAIEIQKDTPAGTKIPLTLYVWNADRQLSVVQDTLVVE